MNPRIPPLPRRRLKEITKRFSPLDDAVMALKLAGFISPFRAKSLHRKIAERWQKELRQAMREAQ